MVQLSGGPAPSLPPPQQQGLNQQLLRLSGLLQLEQKLRRASAESLPFLVVNEVLTVIAYQQSALWIRDGAGPGEGHLAALSGIPQIDPHAPYALWLKDVLAALASHEQADKIRPLTAADVPEPLREQWSEWLPPYALWLPLTLPEGTLTGGLLLARPDEWGQADLALTGLLAETIAQRWVLTHLPRGLKPLVQALHKRRKLLAGVAVGLLLLALIPVRQSVLSPAEIVPVTPLLVRAPFDGVIDAMHVSPNADVKEGQVLLSFDVRQLRSRLTVAVKAKEMAEAELQQASQQSFSDSRAKAQVALLRSKVEQQNAELTFIQDQLSRAEMQAPGSGLAVYDDPADWIGRPVSTGERIMMIAAPDKTELEIRVPVADAITFDKGAEVVFFPNIAPEHPVGADLIFASYGSSMSSDNILSYRYRAALTPGQSVNGQPLRLGIKGIAKIYGDRRPLLLWLLRRPLGVVRQWLTL